MDLASEAQPVEPMQHGPLRAVQSMSRLQPAKKEGELRKTKSIRARPADLMDRQESIPRLPLKDSTQARGLQPRSSKLSLFHLFSKPKVEKLRGYTETESQHTVPPNTANQRSVGGPEADLTVRRQGTASDIPSTRPGSSKAQAVVGTARLTPKERATTAPQQRRSAPFSPPPLFQAYPQATKHGVLEIPAISPDSTQKAKSYRSGGSQAAGVETIRKIFVLVTSGYLLQYTYDGPSDRHPEKILELGKESAAFACDLVPGQHFVLQVSHAVSRHGIIATNSTSLLTRLGLRGNTSRRMISNCWLILTTAEEMDSWMLAIRQEIEILGGSRAREHLVTALSAANEQARTSPEKAPSTSHRYQVKRDPSKVLSIASPSDKTTFPSGPLTPSVKVDDDSVETATIDDIEIEASAIVGNKQATRARATSDAPSATSSTAQSVEQQQLERIRNSIRISHTSSRITGLTSRTNSPTSSHPCDGPLKSPSEPVPDATTSTAPYRTQPSHSSGSRRSLLPLLLSKDETLSENKGHDAATMQDSSTVLIESPTHLPTVDQHPTSTDTLHSPQKHLSMAQSVPNLRMSAGVKKRHDSKIQSPKSNESSDRPESVLGELPSPSAWASKTSPNPRNSTFLLASGVEQSSSHSAKRTSSQTRRRTVESQRSLNGPSASFSLPLKINAPDQPSARSVRRASQAMDQADVASPVPVVHTLTAKVDLATRTTISNAHIPPRRSSSAGAFGVDPAMIASPNTNSRLSLFPSQAPALPPSFAADRIKRSPSTSALSSQNPSQAATAALKRPTSMQVRSSNAAFLSSVRNSGRGLPMAPMRPGTTVPIRSLKPSRNSVIMQSPGFMTSQDPFYEAKLASVALAAEAGEGGLSLPLQHHSPPNPIMQSAPVISSRRTSRIKSGTLLELGMPLVALGPPAPPPRAPLPEIPTTSKPNSPTSDTSSNSRNLSRKDSPPRPGLGIQIINS